MLLNECDNAFSRLVYLDDVMELKKIEIICHPRKKFRPRTLNESIAVAHYIRCEDTAPIDYPTIHVCSVKLLVWLGSTWCSSS